MADENPISYDVDADDKFKKAMANAIASGLDLSFSMGESVRIIKKESGKNFILKGFGKYPPLSPEYLRRKLFLAPGAPILTGAKPGSIKDILNVTGGGMSGKLKKSIINTTADSIVLIGKRSVEFGTKAESKDGAPYPVYVQEGTENKDGSERMPGRKFLFFSQAMVKQIINTINADIANQLPS
jgi:phage gpG-like protein